MHNRTDRERSVYGSVKAFKPIALSLSLLLPCAAMGISFLASVNVQAEEERRPLAAVEVVEPLIATSVSAVSAGTSDTTSSNEAARSEEPALANEAEPLTATSYVETETKASSVSVQETEPLVATSVESEEEPLVATSLIPEVTQPQSYVNEYLGFTRTDLVSYLVSNAGVYLGTPYKEATVAPEPGLNGHMQCEGFIWDVMLAVSTQNQTDIPCGNMLTEPANGGGWVNWSYYHKVDPITFNTKEEMLASGVLEKGDVIWSFDVAGPYGLSNANHVGFFWGDNPHDDKFWESAVRTNTECYAGSVTGNRIARIESMSAYPSVWWVFKLSPDAEYDPTTWAGLPAAGMIEPGDADEKENAEEDADAAEKQEAAADTEGNVADTEEYERTDTDSSSYKEEDAKKDTDGYEDVVVSSYEPQSGSSQGTIFYNGQDEDTGYYSSVITEDNMGYDYGY